MYIYQQKDWPAFRWDKEVVDKLLNRVYGAVGFLMGRLSVIGFDEKMLAAVESISHDIIASSEIEGVALNNEEVRSSVAHQLGVQLPNRQSSSRYIDGVVKMALDATVNYDSPLTRDRIFGSFFLRQLRQLLTTFFLCCHFNMTTTGTTSDNLQLSSSTARGGRIKNARLSMLSSY
ncbi:MAG: DUF4172 domain-containing protein [Alloprevotella sp.]